MEEYEVKLIFLPFCLSSTFSPSLGSDLLGNSCPVGFLFVMSYT